jgi:hypothetical protein
VKMRQQEPAGVRFADDDWMAHSLSAPGSGLASDMMADMSTGKTGGEKDLAN